MTQESFATIEEVFENPGGRVLRIRTGLACNVPDETIHAHVAENVRNQPADWLKLSASHDRTALLCGSGPSLSDCIEQIRSAQRDGAKVFAMNGAASFLWCQHRILPDYQIMMDAKLETATLIGPALEYLFASQVNPACFKRKPQAMLWHSTHGEWIPEFPDHSDDYCVIGGSVTVGNTAPALVYAMGYRSIRCFGYDSSHRGSEGHAFAQPMNDADACMVTRFGGEDYLSSYAMKLQAETFMQRGRQLEGLGCVISVEGTGLLPAMWQAMKKPMSEREKYALMWDHSEYRVCSPGENAVARFTSIESERGSILDIGCGTGRASVGLKASGFDPFLIDFTENSRDPGASGLVFLCRDVVHDELPHTEFGFCTDVMEHLPPEQVDDALRNILSSCGRVFFTISTVPDAMGVLIGKELHLTVKPYEWWEEKLISLGAAILHGERTPDTAIFYVQRNHQSEV